MKVITAQATSNVYTSALTLEDVYGSSGGGFVVKDQSVMLSVQTGGQGSEQWSADVPWDPSIGNSLPRGTIGVRFRSFTVGKPATVSAWLASADEVVPTGGSALSAATTFLAGIVNADGTIASGSGFSVVHTGVGTYQLTYTTAFSTQPVVVGGTLAVSQYVFFVTASSANGFSAELRQPGVGDADEPWNFLATLPT